MPEAVMGSAAQRIFSEKARSMVATSARLALFWGLRVRASVEELLMTSGLRVDGLYDMLL